MKTVLAKCAFAVIVALIAPGCGGSSSDSKESNPSTTSTSASKPKPVTNPDMDPRVVEPCVTECKAKNDSTTPAYKTCFAACKTRKAAEINASAK